MRRTRWGCLLAAAACLPGAAQAATCESLDALAWLLGGWVAEGDKTEFHESWTQVAPGSFEGAGVERSKADGKIRSSEALRLVQMAGRVYYIAKAAHNELPVAFRLSECEATRFVFVNPAHDFPRRIEYARSGQARLAVRVSDGAAKGFTLDFARATEPQAPADAVLAAEDARFTAMISGLAKEMHRWFAADLTYVHSTGEVENRDELIESIASGGRRYLAIEPGERSVSFLDEAAAVVLGPAQIRVVAGASELALDVRYVAVYVQVDGAWQLHAWQSLRLP